MEKGIKLRIILECPTAGVDFGLQKGKGNNYETIQKQRSAGERLSFELVLKVKMADNELPVFLGLFAQGTSQDRFIYIDIGTYAGQKDSPCGRRLKIPLIGITSEMIHQMLSDTKLMLVTTVPGTGKDGGPNCATVKPFAGWKLL
ncbi:MAG: hypothetical protein JWP81_2587 [Ferruginibacter sp.]|nr:hypothetical protein [Ferruginibacter sp.]